MLKYSSISISEIEEELKNSQQRSKEEISLQAESLQAELLYENDVAMIYYVSGYCCRSSARSNKCNDCKKETILMSLQTKLRETIFHKIR